MSPTAQPAEGPPTIVRLDPRLDPLLPKSTVDREARGWLCVGGRSRMGPLRQGPAVLGHPEQRHRTLEGRRRASATSSRPSGYSGSAPFTGREPGSNGLTFDSKGRLVLCQHGDRRIARLDATGRLTNVVDKFEGKRLNSPNDLVFKSNGDLYFTDPGLRPAEDVRRSARESCPSPASIA